MSLVITIELTLNSYITWCVSIRKSIHSYLDHTSKSHITCREVSKIAGKEVRRCVGGSGVCRGSCPPQTPIIRCLFWRFLIIIKSRKVIKVGLRKNNCFVVVSFAIILTTWINPYWRAGQGRMGNGTHEGPPPNLNTRPASETTSFFSTRDQAG